MAQGIVIDDLALGSAVSKKNPLPIYTPAGFGMQQTDGTRYADIASGGTANTSWNEGPILMGRDTLGTFYPVPLTPAGTAVSVDTELPTAAALADGVSSTNVEPRVAADMQGIRSDASANSDRAVLSKMQDLNSGAGTEMVVGVTIRKAGPSGSLPDDGYPSGAVAVTSASGNKANAAGTATLTAGASTTAYISGFECTSTGATVGLPVIVTVTGTISGTLSYIFAAPAGALLIATPLVVQFCPPIPASAVNTNIVVTLPALGAGNTNAAVVAHGYIL